MVRQTEKQNKKTVKKRKGDGQREKPGIKNQGGGVGLRGEGKEEGGKKL